MAKTFSDFMYGLAQAAPKIADLYVYLGQYEDEQTLKQAQLGLQTRQVTAQEKESEASVTASKASTKLSEQTIKHNEEIFPLAVAAEKFKRDSAEYAMILTKADVEAKKRAGGGDITNFYSDLLSRDKEEFDAKMQQLKAITLNAQDEMYTRQLSREINSTNFKVQIGMLVKHIGDTPGSQKIAELVFNDGIKQGQPYSKIMERIITNPNIQFEDPKQKEFWSNIAPMYFQTMENIRHDKSEARVKAIAAIADKKEGNNYRKMFGITDITDPSNSIKIDNFINYITGGDDELDQFTNYYNKYLGGNSPNNDPSNPFGLNMNPMQMNYGFDLSAPIKQSDSTKTIYDNVEQKPGIKSLLKKSTQSNIESLQSGADIYKSGATSVFDKTRKIAGLE